MSDKSSSTLNALPLARSNRMGAIATEILVGAMAAEYLHRPYSGPHEGYAVILEELDELWEHVRADTGRSDEARKEAIQIAATALRYVLCVCDGEAS